ncbi:MAG: polymer-forming cytoskeletal protein [Bacteroidota bacterium]|nr:polymer-forming cytoskeletal protein [Bacteroidota bacterium]
MKRFITLFFSSLLFLSISYAQSNDSSFDDSTDRFERTADDIGNFVENLVEKIESQVERMAEERSQRVEYGKNEDQDKDKTKIPSDAITFNGDTEIAEHDTIQGDLVVKNGTLTIRGIVEGDVLVVNGDIELKSTSHVNGNVRAMNGSITKSDGAYIEGYTEQSSNSSSGNNRKKKTYRTKYSYSFGPYFWNTENVFDDNFLFRYNRVEGFFFGFGKEKSFYWDGSKAVSGFGSFGYGFASHKWRLQLGLDRQFAASSSSLYEVGVEAHSLTDTKDEWIMNLGENNLASLFFREDFRDYFQREGFSTHAAWYTKDGDVSSMIDIRFLNDRYASMNNNATWAVFGGNVFRSNPAVNIGTMKSVTFSAGISTVEKYRYRSEGWNAFARAEYGGRELGGDFDFTQTLVDVRRFQPLFDDNQVNLRVRAGALEGAPIVQKSFELGGANTIPAFGFKEFVGNRLVLANLEYQLSGEVIDEIFFWPNSLNLVAFGDAGAVTTVNKKWAVYEGFDSIKSNQIKSDLGFALAWHDGDARLGFAWRTDKTAPVSIFFRLNRAF